MQRQGSDYQRLWNNEKTSNLYHRETVPKPVLPINPTRPIVEHDIPTNIKPEYPRIKHVYRRGPGYASLSNYNQIP